MPVYTCQRCLKDFKQKGHLASHMNRKNPCQEVKLKLESMVESAVETKIENALDEIDECYGEISQVLEKPLFYDSVEVRQVLSQIKKISDIILDIARQIGTVEDNSTGE